MAGELVIRFHLHPSLKATLSKDSATIMLILPNKMGWRFSARGGTLSLEESIYLSGRPGRAPANRSSSAALSP